MDERHRRVTAPRPGEQNSNSMLTIDAVTALRRDYVNGVELPLIASRYGVSLNSLTDYTTGRSWKHILGQNGCPTLTQLKSENQRRRRNNARLSQDIATEIRSKLALGALGIDLAKEYGVTPTTISDIKRGKIWA